MQVSDLIACLGPLLKRFNDAARSTWDEPFISNPRRGDGHRCGPSLGDRPLWTCPVCNTRWQWVDFLPRRLGGPYGWAKTIVQPRPWFPPGWWR